MHEYIENILKTAVYAPSGGNSQPWQFEVRGNEIAIIALPEKDHPILNYRNRGTWMAHGALIENIVIAASNHGFRAGVGPLFPKKNLPNLVTRIILEPGAITPDLLYQVITKRATNRKPYETTPIARETEERFHVEAVKGGNEYLTLVNARDNIDALAHAVSINEIVMLENRLLHDLFFHEIVWAEEEEKRKKSGLYIKTMELTPPKEKAMQLFKHWPLMRLAIFLGIPKKIAEENAVVYRSCSSYAVIACRNRDESFIAAGRMMQRLWLTAETLGLSGHLITGIFFLHQRIAQDTTNLFSKRHTELIRHAYQKAAEATNVPNDKIIAAALRIGRDGEPSAHSSRREPNIVYA